MFLQEMTPEMRTMLALFNEEMTQAGWEVGNFDALFTAGMSVSPEASATLRHEEVTLEVNLSLPEWELQLHIQNEERDHLVRLVLECRENLPGLLRSLTSRQEEINTATFPQFLLKSAPYTENVWFVDHEGTRFLLELPGAAE